VRVQAGNAKLIYQNLNIYKKFSANFKLQSFLKEKKSMYYLNNVNVVT
jgi:hypothetical protein